MYADVRQYNNKRRLMAALMREALKTYDDESSLFAGLPDLLAGMLLEDSALIDKLNLDAFAHLGAEARPKDPVAMAELVVWDLLKSMHACEIDTAAMRDILVVILSAAFLKLQNKLKDVSELLEEESDEDASEGVATADGDAMEDESED